MTSSADWFAKKMGQPVPTQQPQPVQYQPQVPMPQNYAPTPPSYQAPMSPTCPECRSQNYAVAAKQITQSGQVESWRCYDCGYPLIQAGSSHGGANSAPSSGPAQKAVQVPTGGYNPQTIIGHL
jgi:hypothetical protein